MQLICRVYSRASYSRRRNIDTGFITIMSQAMADPINFVEWKY